MYYKVASRAQLVAEPMIFKMFMKRKIDALCTLTIGQKVPKLNGSLLSTTTYKVCLGTEAG